MNVSSICLRVLNYLSFEQTAPTSVPRLADVPSSSILCAPLLLHQKSPLIHQSMYHFNMEVGYSYGLHSPSVALMLEMKMP